MADVAENLAEETPEEYAQDEGRGMDGTEIHQSSKVTTAQNRFASDTTAASNGFIEEDGIPMNEYHPFLFFNTNIIVLMTIFIIRIRFWCLVKFQFFPSEQKTGFNSDRDIRCLRLHRRRTKTSIFSTTRRTLTWWRLLSVFRAMRTASRTCKNI